MQFAVGPGFIVETFGAEVRVWDIQSVHSSYEMGRAGGSEQEGRLGVVVIDGVRVHVAETPGPLGLDIRSRFSDCLLLETLLAVGSVDGSVSVYC